MPYIHPDAAPAVRPLLDMLAPQMQDESAGSFAGMAPGQAVAWWIVSEYLRNNPPPPPQPEIPPGLQVRMIGVGLLLASVVAIKLDIELRTYEQEVEWALGMKPKNKGQEMAQLVRGIVEVFSEGEGENPQQAQQRQLARRAKRKRKQGKRVWIVGWSRKKP